MYKQLWVKFLDMNTQIQRLLSIFGQYRMNQSALINKIQKRLARDENIIDKSFKNHASILDHHNQIFKEHALLLDMVLAENPKLDAKFQKARMEMQIEEVRIELDHEVSEQKKKIKVVSSSNECERTEFRGNLKLVT